MFLVQRTGAEEIRGFVLLDISNFPWAECSITENRVLHISDSLSLKRSKRSTGIHRYEFELVTYDMDTSEGLGIMAKLSAAADDVINFVHPRLSYSRGTIPGAGIEIASSALAGVSQVDITSANSWQLLAGDYLNFSNDSKVYQVAEDTLLQVGSQTVKLTSSLRNAVSASSTVTAEGVTWSLSSNGVIEASMEASEGQEIQITLVAVEQL